MHAKVTSSATGDFRRAAPKMDTQEARLGSEIYTSWSSRPGRMIPGSRMSGKFVAPMTKRVFLTPMPSIYVRIWLMTRSEG